MNFFSSRRRRNATAGSGSDRDDDDGDDNDAVLVAGVGSPLGRNPTRNNSSNSNENLLRSRSKRREAPSASGGSGGILPLTTTPTGRSISAADPTTAAAALRQPQQHYHPHQSALPSASSNTCNSFLLGGNYYPGKDKGRRHHHLQRHRKTSLGHRIFCSSPWRMVLSAVAVAYVVVWHVLLPFAGLVFYYGGLLSSSLSSSSSANPGGGLAAGQLELGEEWLLNHYRLPFSLPMLEDERSAVEDLVQQRQILVPRMETARRKILERIVPDWLHRNDKTTPILQGNADDRQQQQQGKESSSDSTSRHLEGKHDPSGTIKWHQSSQSRTLRTLENMASYPNDSKCPAINNNNNNNPHETDRDSSIRVSLVVQASLDRVWVLDETCRRWRDPIVVVVGVTAEEQGDENVLGSAPALLAGWQDKCPQLQLILHRLDERQSEPENYPVNHLRNVALDAVQTSHLLVVDADFVPSDRLDETIRSALEERRRLRLQAEDQGGIEVKVPGEDEEALVVPAFERVLHPPCTTEDECKLHLRESSSFIPHTFDDLKSCVDKKDCIVFQSDVNWEGHYSTRSEEWLEGDWYESADAQDFELGDLETRARNIKSVKCFDTLRYEPYIVLRWCPRPRNVVDEGKQREDDPSVPRPVAPYYDERFHGYGKNKIEYISHLRLLGYRFAVLPEGFIVHNPHVESKAKEIWKNVQSSDLHESMDRLYPIFLRELVDLYHERRDSIVRPCPREDPNR